nr:MAG TPA: Integrase [Caudoviricetes sp.]
MITKTFSYNGKRYYVRGNTERAVIEKLILKKQALERDEVLNPARRTVASWALECVDTYKVNQSEITREKYLQKLKSYVLNEIGALLIKDVTPIMCQRVLNLKSSKSKATINDTYQMLRFIFKYAKINKLINIDPTENLVKPSGYYNPRRSLTTSEEQHFLNVLNQHYVPIYFALMYYAGCRPSEASAVEFRDIVTRDGERYLHIRGTKTKAADRYVPIVDGLAKLLPHGSSPFELLCKNQQGKALNKDNKRRAWAHLSRLMNIDMGCKLYRNELLPPYPLATDISAYSLRHTFCTNLQKRGVDIRTAQYLMGHADIAMTANIYTHVDFELINQAAALM